MAKTPLLKFALLLLLLLSGAAGCNQGNQDRLSDEQVRGTAEALSPEQRCASEATGEQLKRELFGEAARLRRGDGAAVERLADEAQVRLKRPRLIRNDEATGLIACRGLLAVDLPRGYETFGGRTSLSAQVDYALQEGAEGGEMVTLTGADAIISPLATVAPIVPRTALPRLEPRLDPVDPTYDGPGEVAPPIDELAPVAPPTPQAPAPAPSPARSSPSFDCGDARTRSERAVCASDELASLDRRMAALYNKGMVDADPATRADLRATRDRFLAWRERCSTDLCIAEAYRGRMAEIRDILAEGSLRP